MGGIWTQSFPPSPTLTEKNLPSLAGKVYIVTGGNSGIGFELVKILYGKGAIVYIAGRFPEKIAAAVDEVKSVSTTTSGKVKSLSIDLSDLTTVPKAASTFLAQETRLDVLFNNAGVAQIPAGAISAQGHEIHMGTNCLGPFLFTKLLLPVLLRTSNSEPRGSVRVVFTGSGIIDMTGPPGGLSLDELTPDNYSQDKGRNYSASKAGNWFLASELDRRVRKDGIICVAQNPGTLRTKGWNKVPIFKIIFSPIMYEPIFGAYTELWCGLSQEVEMEDGGKFAIPWGRWHTNPKKHILASMKTKEEGGTGVAAKFWDWCDEQTRDYANVG